MALEAIVLMSLAAQWPYAASPRNSRQRGALRRLQSGMGRPSTTLSPTPSGKCRPAMAQQSHCFSPQRLAACLANAVREPIPGSHSAQYVLKY